MNFKNRRHEVECVAESEIFPNRRIFVCIVGWEIEEKVERYSQSDHYYLFLKKLSATNNIFGKLLAGGGAGGKIRNSPKPALLCFHCCVRNWLKNAFQAAGNFTTKYLLYLKYIVPNKYFQGEVMWKVKTRESAPISCNLLVFTQAGGQSFMPLDVVHQVKE